jgi:hypothetical protein
MRSLSAKALGALLACALLGVASGTAQRHLTYAYAVYPTADRAGPVTTFEGSGTGIMDVAILGQASDGGMLIEARDWWWNAVRPQQTAQCEIYDNDEINCAEFPLLSDAQHTLLPLLAKTFYPGASTSQWRRQYAFSCGVISRSAKCTADLTYSAKGANGSVEIAAQGTYQIVGFRDRTMHDRASIEYDPVAALPILVHDSKSGTSETIFHSRSVDLKLVDDSSH